MHSLTLLKKWKYDFLDSLRFTSIFVLDRLISRVLLLWPISIPNIKARAVALLAFAIPSVTNSRDFDPDTHVIFAACKWFRSSEEIFLQTHLGLRFPLVLYLRDQPAEDHGYYIWMRPYLVHIVVVNGSSLLCQNCMSDVLRHELCHCSLQELGRQISEQEAKTWKRVLELAGEVNRLADRLVPLEVFPEPPSQMLIRSWNTRIRMMALIMSSYHNLFHNWPIGTILRILTRTMQCPLCQKSQQEVSSKSSCRTNAVSHFTTRGGVTRWIG